MHESAPLREVIVQDGLDALKETWESLKLATDMIADRRKLWQHLTQLVHDTDVVHATSIVIEMEKLRRSGSFY